MVQVVLIVLIIIVQVSYRLSDPSSRDMTSLIGQVINIIDIHNSRQVSECSVISATAGPRQHKLTGLAIGTSYF